MNRTLRGTIGRQARISDESVVRAEIDDAGAGTLLSRRAKQRQGMFRGQERTCDIDGERTVPFVECGLLDGFLDLDSGCVDKNVEPAHLILHAVHRSDALVLNRDIKSNKMASVFIVPVERTAGAQVGRIDGCALVQETRNDCASNAASATRDERGLSFKLHVRFSPVVAFPIALRFRRATFRRSSPSNPGSRAERCQTESKGCPCIGVQNKPVKVMHGVLGLSRA